MTDLMKPKDKLQLNIFLYDIDFVDGELNGELARKSIQKFEKSVKFHVTTITFVMYAT